MKKKCEFLGRLTLLMLLIPASASAQAPYSDAQINRAVDGAIANVAAAASADEGIGQANTRNATLIAAGEMPFSLATTTDGEVIPVATGVASYAGHGDVGQRRRRLMTAVQVANTLAHRNLAAGWGGVHLRMETTQTQTAATVADGDAVAANLELLQREVLHESTDATLRSVFVTAIRVTDAIVSVSVACSTRSPARAIAHDYVSGDLTSAIYRTVAELPLLPARGSVLVDVEGGGQAVIGYGTALVESHDQPAVQSQLALQAKRVAMTLAQASIVAFLSGEDVRSSSTLETSVADSYAEFAGDSLATAPLSEKARRDAAQRFRTAMRSSESISIVASGRLPAGVPIRTYFRPDLGTAHAIAVYHPRLTAAAQRGYGDESLATSLDQDGIVPSREFVRWPSGSLPLK